MQLQRMATIGLVCGALVAGCASPETKDDEKPQTETQQKDEQQKDEQQKEKEKTAQKPDLSEVIPQVDSLELREEAPDPEKLGEQDAITAHSVGGLKVIHKQTPANQVVSAKLYIDGGVAGMSDRTAGIEKLALRTATNGGTESMSKDEFTSTLDSMGSSVSSFTDRDYSGVSLRTITKHFDESWELFADAIMHPAMPADELKVQRKKQLAEIDQIRESPNDLVSHLARRQMAGSDHPYRLFQHGTPENVKAFERDHLLSWQRSLLEPSRLVLVVVGDVSTDKVLDKTSETLGRLKDDDWESPDLPDFSVAERAMKGAAKKIPTNYILGLFAAPGPKHEDYAATKLAMSYLSDRLFEEVRTKRNLSYAVSSGLGDNRTNNGYLYVSAQQPNQTMTVIFDQVKQLKQETLSEDQLERTRNVFITEHYMDLETNSSQATNLAQAELKRGDWRKHDALLEELESVTPKDIKRVADKYMKNYQFGVVGNPGSIDESVFGVSPTGN